MRALRIQGIVFVVTAVLLTIISFTLERLQPLTELTCVVILIFILGVPHGALDTIFAAQQYRLKSLKGWFVFASIYLSISGLIICLWYVSAIVFFLSFLVISIAHFSGDPREGTPILSRVLYGGAIIILPAILHSGELNQLFSFFIEAHLASLVSSTLKLIAGPWLIAIIFAAVHRTFTDLLSGLEIAAVGLIAVILPPLIAFTLFFCCMHSARHILRTALYSKKSCINLFRSMIIPMSSLVIIMVISWSFSEGINLDARLMQLIFVGLAALTVPHMMLVERVRFAGWFTGSLFTRV